MFPFTILHTGYINCNSTQLFFTSNNKEAGGVGPIMCRRCSILVIASMLFLLPYTAARAQTFIVQGSTTFANGVMEPYQTAIEASSGHKLTVVPNKSSLGILALFEKRADFAMISGPLEKEVEDLKLHYPELPFDRLRIFNISSTRMAFAINPENPVHEITADKMRRILLGEITNWRDVGGRDLPIRIVQVREGGGVQASIEEELLKGKSMNVPNPIRVQISSQVIKVVEQVPEALGLSQLSLVIKFNTGELKTDHPVEQHLDLVTLGDPTPEMRKVIDAAHNIARTAFER
jgi:phosphate transport system substrate-binding protein